MLCLADRNRTERAHAQSLRLRASTHYAHKHAGTLKHARKHMPDVCAQWIAQGALNGQSQHFTAVGADLAAFKAEKEADMRALQQQLAQLQEGVRGLQAVAVQRTQAVAAAGGNALQQVRGCEGCVCWVRIVWLWTSCVSDWLPSRQRSRQTLGA